MSTSLSKELQAKYNVGLDQIRKTEEHVYMVLRRLDETAPILVEN